MQTSFILSPHGYKRLFPHSFSLGAVYKTQIFNNVTKPQNNVNTLKIAALFCITVIFLKLAMSGSHHTGFSHYCLVLHQSYYRGVVFSDGSYATSNHHLKICLTFSFTDGHKPLYPLVVSFKVYTVYTNTEVT